VEAIDPDAHLIEAHRSHGENQLAGRAATSPNADTGVTPTGGRCALAGFTPP
jgi:hypothetical protein